MKRIFEIHAAGLDSGQVTEQIEQDLEKAAFDPALVDHVAALTFTPVSPGGDGGFDPALTAELFERPVSAPDFASRKYRLIRGPLRALASALFRMLVQIDEKLSENKVQSFYHVVHELLGLAHRMQTQQSRLSAVEEAVLREISTRSVSASNVSPNGFRPGKEQIPLPGTDAGRRNQALALEVARLQGTGRALCLDDAWGHFAVELEKSGLTVECSQADAFRAGMTGAAHGFVSHSAESVSALAAGERGSYAVITHLSLEEPSGDPRLLPGLLASRAAPGGVVALRWTAADTASPFRKAVSCVVDRAALIKVLASLGFDVVVSREEAPLGSFELILRREG